MVKTDDVEWYWRLVMLLLQLWERATWWRKRKQPEPNSKPKRKKSKASKRKPNPPKPKKPKTTKPKRKKPSN